MNVCFLSKSFSHTRGGIETYVRDMAEALTKVGHNVHIITLRSSVEKTHTGSLNEKTFIHEVKDNREPFRGSWRIDRMIPFLDICYSYKVYKLLSQLIKNYKIDIVESPDWLYEGYWFSFQRRSIPLIARFHGHISIFLYYYTKTMKRNLHNRIKWWQEKKQAVNADGISINSSFYAGIVKKNWLLDLRKIKIIPNGVNMDIFSFSPNRKNEDITLLYVGRLEENKGIGILCDALLDVYKEYPLVKTIFVGLDKQHERFKCSWRQFLNEKLKNFRVQFIDPVNRTELSKLYRESTVCIFPSLYEAFGITALEAMSCGRPVIATRTGGFPDMIQNLVNGILVSPGDIKELSSAIKMLINNSELRDKLGREARVAVENKFCIGKVAQMTIDFYRETISKFQTYTAPH
jgi:glycosyltransferase involved in cell wall biosynthesis